MRKIYITLLTALIVSMNVLSANAEITLPQQIITNQFASTQAYKFLALEQQILAQAKMNPSQISAVDLYNLDYGKKVVAEWADLAFAQANEIKSSGFIGGVPLPIAGTYAKLRLADIQREIARIHNGNTEGISMASIETYMSELKSHEHLWRKLVKVMR